MISLALTILLAATTATTQPLYPGLPYQEVMLSGRCHRIYITVDDHPNSSTPYILRVLRRYGVKSTFFLTTWPLHAAYHHPRQRSLQRLLRYTRAVVKAGHVIANHTHNHRYLCRLSRNGAYRQIWNSQYWIYQQLGLTPKYWRAPFLALCPKVVKIARRLGLVHMTAHLSDIGSTGAKMWRYTRWRARRGRTAPQYRHTIALFHRDYWDLREYLKRLRRAPRCKTNGVRTNSITTIRTNP